MSILFVNAVEIFQKFIIGVQRDIGHISQIETDSTTRSAFWAVFHEAEDFVESKEMVRDLIVTEVSFVLSAGDSSLA